MCSYGKVHRCYEQCFIFKARANALSSVLSTVKCQIIFRPSIIANIFQDFTQNVLNKYVLITKRFIMSKRPKNNKVGVDLVATCKWSFPLRPWEDREGIKEDRETNLWLWEEGWPKGLTVFLWLALKTTCFTFLLHGTTRVVTQWTPNTQSL